MAVRGTKAWVDKLSRQEMPVLSEVVKELNELTGSDDTQINQMSDVILKDANLTSQVLRIANSVHYNPSSAAINTVSRAIVLIGFTGVRAICVSVMMIDSLLGKEPREYLLKAMAKAFHAAVQARNLVKRTNDEFKEEVFIAALLFHLGDMAFWSCGGPAADELDELLQDPDANYRECVEQVIGATLKSVTKGLAGIWKLGETLEEALYPPKKPSAKAIAVRLGVEISRAAEKGWDAPEVHETVCKVAKFSGQPFMQARDNILAAADEAASVALTYGAAQVCHFIPSSTQKMDMEEHIEEESHVMQADPQLQLNILRELTAALAEQVDVNTIFQMVLEGLHRGIALERVCVAFIMKDRAQAKYILGRGTHNWREKFDFPMGKHDDNIFTHAAKKREAIWVGSKDGGEGEMKHLSSPEVSKVIGKEPAFIGVIGIGPRNVALFYADRGGFGGSLDQEQFESFRHFVSQTQTALENLSGGKKK